MVAAVVWKEMEVHPLEVEIQDQAVEEEEDIVLKYHLQDLALVALRTLEVEEVVQRLLGIQVVVLLVEDLVL